MDKVKKQLFVTTCPVPGEAETELEMQYGGRDIGSVTLHHDDFAEFIESLRGGFTVVITQPPAKRRPPERYEDDENDVN